MGRSSAFAPILVAWLLASPGLALSASRSAQDLLKEFEAQVLQQFPLMESARQEVRRVAGEAEGALGAFYDPLWRTSAFGIPTGPYEFAALDTWVEQATPLLGTRVVGGYRSSWGLLPLYEGKLETASLGEVRLGLEIPLLRNSWIDPRRARIESARIRQTEADASLDSTKWETLRSLRKSFWSWVLSGHHVQIQKELLALATVRDEQIKKSVKLGESAAIDQVDNSRAIAQRTAAVVSAQFALQKATLDLSLYYRDTSGAPIQATMPSPPPTLPPASPIEFEESSPQALEALNQHPDVLRLEAASRRAQVEVRNSSNQQFPRLDLFAYGAQDMGTGSATLLKPELRFGAHLEIPILNRSAGGQRTQAEAAAIQVDLAKEFTRDRLALAVQESIRAINAAVERIEAARQEIALAVELERAERKRLKVGASNLFLVNLREQATADARQREVLAYDSYLKSRTDFDTIARRAD